MGTAEWLLLAFAPWLLIAVVFMVVGLFTGPRVGGFTVRLTWPWLWVVLPCAAAGVVGIAMEVAHAVR